MSLRRITLALVAVTCLTVPLRADADPILDQSLVPPQPEDALFALINECCPLVGQTYTAGLTGRLTAVKVAVRGYDERYPLHIDIYRVSGGIPAGDPLGGTTLDTASSRLTNLIAFSTPIPQVAGLQYAIVASFFGAPPAGPYQALGDWEGTPGTRFDLYPRGQLISRLADQPWVPPDPSHRNWEDLYFQTFVQPVPEPGTILLLAGGTIGLWYRTRRRETASL